MMAHLLMFLIASIAGRVAQPPAKVDGGHVDTSPNGISFKKMEMGQRLPTGFEGVYQWSKVDALGRGQNTFLRIDGAVTAVFPRSVYIPTRGGLVPEIPPGTVFHIGPLPRPPEPVGHIPDTFVDLSVGAQAPVPNRPAIVGIGSIITDEAYRHQRIAALMARAIGD